VLPTLLIARDAPIHQGMKHIVSDLGDVPPPLPGLDRRRVPDRRRAWRGGRRDTDWKNRPLGALDRLDDAKAKVRLLRKALSALHLW
jgi:hypothetical protein